MSPERWLVSICAGRWQLDGIHRARRVGLRVLALDGDAAAPGLAEADRGLVVDIRDPRAVVAAVESSSIVPAGAISFVAEAGMPAAASLRERFGLPGPNSRLTLALTDKAEQRKAWLAAGIPGPRWSLARTVAEAEAALAQIGLPAIIKPVDSAGSRGVTKIETPDQFASAAASAFASSRSGRVLVESYMNGQEFTVETFAAAGRTTVLAVTEKIKVPGTGGTVAMELATPDRPKSEVEAVAAAAVAALTALGHTDGPGHTEVILGPQGPGLVESAGRGGGFMVFEGLIPLASGFDAATACALQAVGLIPPAPGDGPRRAVVLRFFPSRRGVVRAVEGLEKANALSDVKAGAFVAVGDRVGQARSDGDRLGYVLAAADSPGNARRLADRAQACVRFVLEEEDVKTASH